jgi:hypothetical protein
MKKLLFLLFLLPALAFAQSQQPFKKASTIEVHTSLTPEQAYKQLAMALQESGYSIASSDATLQSITTSGRQYKNIAVVLNTSVKGDSTAVIVLKGNFRLADFTPSAIEYRGANGSPAMRAWEQMEGVAKALPSSKVVYR